MRPAQARPTESGKKTVGKTGDEQGDTEGREPVPPAHDMCITDLARVVSMNGEGIERLNRALFAAVVQ